MKLSKQQIIGGFFLILTILLTLVMPLTCSGQDAEMYDKCCVDNTDYSETHQVMFYLFDGTTNVVDTVIVDAANSVFLDEDYDQQWRNIMLDHGYLWDRNSGKWIMPPETVFGQSNAMGSAEDIRDVNWDTLEGAVPVSLPDTLLIIISGQSNKRPPSFGKLFFRPMQKPIKQQ